MRLLVLAAFVAVFLSVFLIANAEGNSHRGPDLRGKVSWFGGPGDGQGTASGIPTSVPGIAVYNQRTLRGYWLIHLKHRWRSVRQTDIGPAPWTGRVFDFDPGAVRRFGYHGSDFPTDSRASGWYLGKSRRRAQARARVILRAHHAHAG